MTRSAGVVAGATLASRVLGLLRDIVLANLFAAASTDAFFIAFMIPNLFRRLVAEGSLTVSFVPVFTDLLRRSREAAHRFLDATWTLGLAVGAILTLGGIVLADPLVHTFAPGFALEPGKHELAVALLRWCFPYILFLILVAVAMGALNSLGHFLTPAVAPVLLNLSLIAGASVGVIWLALPVPIMALGVAAGLAGLLQALLQIPPLRARGMAPRLRWAPGDPEVRRLGLLMLPAILGASVFQINVLVSRFLSSFLGDGAVSYLYYADRLLELPLGLFVFALGTASLPSFARLQRAGDREGLRDGFRSTLRLAVALTVASTVGLVLLREPLFRVLFAWNSTLFGDEAVRGCSLALLCYALGLVPIATARIYVGYSIAHENTRTPAHAAVVALVVNVLASLALIGPLPEGVLPRTVLDLQHALVLAELGYAGLALSASLASAANALYLAVALRRYGPIYRAADARHLAALGLAAALMAGAVGVLLAFWPVRGVAGLGAAVVLGVAVYGLALRVLRSPELDALLRALRRGRAAEAA